MCTILPPPQADSGLYPSVSAVTPHFLKPAYSQHNEAVKSILAGSDISSDPVYLERAAGEPRNEVAGGLWHEDRGKEGRKIMQVPGQGGRGRPGGIGMVGYGHQGTGMGGQGQGGRGGAAASAATQRGGALHRFEVPEDDDDEQQQHEAVEDKPAGLSSSVLQASRKTRTGLKLKKDCWGNFLAH